MINEDITKIKKSGEYRTKDFYHATILKSLGGQLIDLERTGNNFCYFIFDDPDGGVEDIIKRYWNRELLVEPRLMVESINELKTRLHSRG